MWMDIVLKFIKGIFVKLAHVNMPLRNFMCFVLINNWCTQKDNYSHFVVVSLIFIWPFGNSFLEKVSIVNTYFTALQCLQTQHTIFSSCFKKTQLALGND